MKIESVKAREILDSRGNPTIEVDMFTSQGTFSRAAVPSGASTGAFEALELRDQDPKRFLGKGVLKAISNVHEIGDKVQGKDFASLEDFDQHLLDLDGTGNKSVYGANALLGLSLTFAKSLAAGQGRKFFEFFAEPQDATLPVPLMNVLNGGAHANNGLDVQEFMIIPHCGENYLDVLRCGAEIFQTLKKILEKKGLSTAVGDEGGFAPRLENNRAALELLLEAIEGADYAPGKDVSIALDVAATEFFSDKTRSYSFEGKQLSAAELLEVYKIWIQDYPIFSIEDGFGEEDWEGWKLACDSVGEGVQLVGDDLFVTNVERILKGLDLGAANALLVKPNQIGTVSETVKAVNLMHESQLKCVMSHRSGETEDVSISHLAVGLKCSQIKTGSLCRGERTAKYNELLRIEELLPEGAWKQSLERFQVK